MFDPADDFPALVDGLATVTLVRQSSGLMIDVPGALRRAVLRRDTLDSDGRYTACDVVWHLPSGSTADPPRVGDLVVDEDGDPWTILGVRPATLATRWHCLCRNLPAAFGINDTVDLEKAVITPGEPLSWQPWLADLPARIQPVSTTLEFSGETAQVVSLFRVYLLQDVEIDAVCRVLASDGTIYRVLGSRRRGHLDELMYLEVQKTP
ncbi:MAG: hypothetical protein ACYC6Y_23935 [Thermoguttaceae bacterium]